MRKLFLSLIALTLGIGAWAQETQSVDYIDADGQQKTVTATVVTNETGTLSGWNVVLGSDVQTGTLVCNGDVHLILADGAKLTAQGRAEQAAITVSGEGDSLTIYGQAAQSGQLIATGEKYAAGIGGGKEGSGSNITINGGMVTATGGESGSGIGGGYQGSGSNITINGGTVTSTGGMYAAGIGGGENGSGSNITINGGTVTANGGLWGAGIGGGYQGSGSNIKVSEDCHVFADYNNPPTTEIIHNSDMDLASALSVRYAFTEFDQTILSELRAEAIAAIDKAVDGVANDEILAIAREAKNKIMNANGRIVITAIKYAALAELQISIKWYNTGKTDALGPLGEEHPGPAVKVTKGDTEVILYLPDKVEYIIRK